MIKENKLRHDIDAFDFLIQENKKLDIKNGVIAQQVKLTDTKHNDLNSITKTNMVIHITRI